MTPTLRLVKDSTGTRTFLDGHEISGVSDISVKWRAGLPPVAEITVYALLDDYTIEQGYFSEKSAD